MQTAAEITLICRTPSSCHAAGFNSALDPSVESIPTTAVALSSAQKSAVEEKIANFASWGTTNASATLAARTFESRLFDGGLLASSRIEKGNAVNGMVYPFGVVIGGVGADNLGYYVKCQGAGAGK